MATLLVVREKVLQLMLARRANSSKALNLKRQFPLMPCIKFCIWPCASCSNYLASRFSHSDNFCRCCNPKNLTSAFISINVIKLRCVGQPRMFTRIHAAGAFGYAGPDSWPANAPLWLNLMPVVTQLVVRTRWGQSGRWIFNPQ